jgi:hypothetical protein
MNEPAGNPMSLLFMILWLFLFAYLIGILPWRRRRKKKVSLSKQIQFAYIWLFIWSGVGFVSIAILLTNQRELSLMGVLVLLVAADFFTTAILFIKRSMHALKSLMGAMALSLFSFVYFWVFPGQVNETSIVTKIFLVIGGLIAIAVVYSPELRGILAIRDLEREVEATSDSVDNKP